MAGSGDFKRPDDDEYWTSPWSDTFLQGDVFDAIPIVVPAPPEAVFVDEGERRFLSGPFASGPAMLISPSCAIAAQGETAPPGGYAHPVRTLIPIRPITDLVDRATVEERNLGNLRADRLRNYLYLPAGPHGPESAALLYMPVSVHHDVIKEDRIAQLTAPAFWHLRLKLTAFFSSVLLAPEDFGPLPDGPRTS